MNEASPSPTACLLARAFDQKLGVKFRLERGAESAVVLRLNWDGEICTWSHPVSPDTTVPSAMDAVSLHALRLVSAVAAADQRRRRRA